ncbi:AraC family transcriptional regulator [Labrenzia sp. PHM005]|uniref:AraC family transcriptional regulator n=1 Tax=Labrenzia sp. PHM005 TaxID=2590016 RepID=UPI0011407AF1|nr:AraC family transcriptional regulator [Labrenzia sp. PHM005]QDG76632.1 AraC family transcriptional regulator [Labrenzia sp. PHM005]
MVLQAHGRTPLSDYRRFQTHDVDEAREVVARHFCSHRLDRMAASDRFDACQHRIAGEHLSLNYLRYGADVTIEPGELTDFFLIQIPLSGTAEVTNGCQTVASNRDTATILNPDRHTAMRWHAGCEQLLLQIDKDFLTGIAANLSGMSLGDGVRFKSEFCLRSVKSSSWYRGLSGVVHAAEEGHAFQVAPSVRQRHIEEGLVMALLEIQENTVSPLLSRPECRAAPAILKRAVTMIHDRLREDISLLDLSRHAGTTPRNLQLIFKRELDRTPVQYLQDCRLNLARHLLLAGNGHLPISEVAELSGHRHLGRFSVAYKKRFGESPRITARSKMYC